MQNAFEDVFGGIFRRIFLFDFLNRIFAAAVDPGVKSSCKTEETGQDKKYPEGCLGKKSAHHGAEGPSDVVADTDFAVISRTFFGSCDVGKIGIGADLKGDTDRSIEHQCSGKNIKRSFEINTSGEEKENDSAQKLSCQEHAVVSETVGEPAAGQGGKDDGNAQKRKNDADQGISQSALLTQINGDERVDDGIRQLIETPGSGKGDAFVVPQVFEKFCKGIHLIITGKKKWILHII